MHCLIDCRREAQVGLICLSHRDRLADLLNPAQRGQIFTKPGEPYTSPSIPALYGLLSTQRATHGLSEVALGSALGPSSPGDDSALVLRDQRSRADGYGPDDVEHAPRPPLVVLQELTRRVIADRGAPERQPRNTVHWLASWLHGQLDWIAAQPWVAEVWYELRSLSITLRAAVGDPAPDWFGTCRAIVNDAGEEDPNGPWRCAVPLYLPEQAPRAPDEPIQLPTVRCSSCGHRYSGPELVQVGRQPLGAAS